MPKSTDCERRPLVSELNANFICVLCGGYFINATTINECIHTFCKSCIVHYLKSHKYCPICDVLVHKENPLLSLRPDFTIQLMTYKIIPELYSREMRRRRQFFLLSESRVQGEAEVASCSKEIPEDRVIIMADETVNFSLEYADSDVDVSPSDQNDLRRIVRYFRCASTMKISSLMKLLSNKFNFTKVSSPSRIILFYDRESQKKKSQSVLLPPFLSMMDVAYITEWNGKDPVPLKFQVMESRLVDAAEEIKKEDEPVERVPLVVLIRSSSKEGEYSIHTKSSAVEKKSPLPITQLKSTDFSVSNAAHIRSTCIPTNSIVGCIPSVSSADQNVPPCVPQVPIVISTATGEMPYLEYGAIQPIIPADGCVVPADFSVVTMPAPEPVAVQGQQYADGVVQSQQYVGEPIQDQQYVDGVVQSQQYVDELVRVQHYADGIQEQQYVADTIQDQTFADRAVQDQQYKIDGMVQGQQFVDGYSIVTTNAAVVTENPYMIAPAPTLLTYCAGPPGNVQVIPGETLASSTSDAHPISNIGVEMSSFETARDVSVTMPDVKRLAPIPNKIQCLDMKSNQISRFPAKSKKLPTPGITLKEVRNTGVTIKEVKRVDSQNANSSRAITYKPYEDMRKSRIVGQCYPINSNKVPAPPYIRRPDQNTVNQSLPNQNTRTTFGNISSPSGPLTKTELNVRDIITSYSETGCLSTGALYNAANFANLQSNICQKSSVNMPNVGRSRVEPQLSETRQSPSMDASKLGNISPASKFVVPSYEESQMSRKRQSPNTDVTKLGNKNSNSVSKLGAPTYQESPNFKFQSAPILNFVSKASSPISTQHQAKDFSQVPSQEAKILNKNNISNAPQPPIVSSLKYTSNAIKDEHVENTNKRKASSPLEVADKKFTPMMQANPKTLSPVKDKMPSNKTHSPKKNANHPNMQYNRRLMNSPTSVPYTSATPYHPAYNPSMNPLFNPLPLFYPNSYPGNGDPLHFMQALANHYSGMHSLPGFNSQPAYNTALNYSEKRDVLKVTGNASKYSEQRDAKQKSNVAKCKEYQEFKQTSNIAKYNQQPLEIKQMGNAKYTEQRERSKKLVNLAKHAEMSKDMLNEVDFKPNGLLPKLTNGLMDYKSKQTKNDQAFAINNLLSPDVKYKNPALSITENKYDQFSLRGYPPENKGFTKSTMPKPVLSQNPHLSITQNICNQVLQHGYSSENKGFPKSTVPKPISSQNHPLSNTQNKCDQVSHGYSFENKGFPTSTASKSVSLQSTKPFANKIPDLTPLVLGPRMNSGVSSSLSLNNKKESTLESSNKSAPAESTYATQMNKKTGEKHTLSPKNEINASDKSTIINVVTSSVLSPTTGKFSVTQAHDPTNIITSSVLSPTSGKLSIIQTHAREDSIKKMDLPDELKKAAPANFDGTSKFSFEMKSSNESKFKDFNTFHNMNVASRIPSKCDHDLEIKEPPEKKKRKISLSSDASDNIFHGCVSSNLADHSFNEDVHDVSAERIQSSNSSPLIDFTASNTSTIDAKVDKVESSDKPSFTTTSISNTTVIVPTKVPVTNAAITASTTNAPNKCFAATKPSTDKAIVVSPSVPISSTAILVPTSVLITNTNIVVSTSDANTNETVKVAAKVSITNEAILVPTTVPTTNTATVVPNTVPLENAVSLTVPVLSVSTATSVTSTSAPLLNAAGTSTTTTNSRTSNNDNNNLTSLVTKSHDAKCPNVPIISTSRAGVKLVSPPIAVASTVDTSNSNMHSTSTRPELTQSVTPSTREKENCDKILDENVTSPEISKKHTLSISKKPSPPLVISTANESKVSEFSAKSNFLEIPEKIFTPISGIKSTPLVPEILSQPIISKENETEVIGVSLKVNVSNNTLTAKGKHTPLVSTELASTPVTSKVNEAKVAEVATKVDLPNNSLIVKGKYTPLATAKLASTQITSKANDLTNEAKVAEVSTKVDLGNLTPLPPAKLASPRITLKAYEATDFPNNVAIAKGKHTLLAPEILASPSITIEANEAAVVKASTKVDLARNISKEEKPQTNIVKYNHPAIDNLKADDQLRFNRNPNSTDTIVSIANAEDKTCATVNKSCPRISAPILGLNRNYSKIQKTYSRRANPKLLKDKIAVKKIIQDVSIKPDDRAKDTKIIINKESVNIVPVNIKIHLNKIDAVNKEECKKNNAIQRVKDKSNNSLSTKEVEPMKKEKISCEVRSFAISIPNSSDADSRTEKLEVNRKRMKT